MRPSAPAAPDGGSTFSDPSLAQFIAQKAGTGLAGKAPQNVPVSQVKALSEQDSPGADIDTRTGTITFHASSVSFTVVAIAPGKPDMTFTVAGLTNPAIIVPQGARVTVRFINNDTDEARGWLITGNKPPFPRHLPGLGVTAGDHGGTRTRRGWTGPPRGDLRVSGSRPLHVTRRRRVFLSSRPGPDRR